MAAGGLNTDSLSMETQKVQLREKMNQKIIKEKVLKELDESQIASEKSSDEEESDDSDDKYENQTSSTETNVIDVDSCVSNAKKLYVDTRYLKIGTFY